MSQDGVLSMDTGYILSVRVAEQSTVLDTRFSPRVWAWVQIPFS